MGCMAYCEHVPDTYANMCQYVANTSPIRRQYGANTVPIRIDGQYTHDTHEYMSDTC